MTCMSLITLGTQMFLCCCLAVRLRAPLPGLLLQQPSQDMGYASGTLFDPSDAVIVGKTVVLTNVSTGHAIKASVGVRGQYDAELREGTYEAGLEDASDLLPYRRSRFRVTANTKFVINLYPVQRTGFAMTVQGDVRLPDPQVSYDTFEPQESLSESRLNLVIQYEKRISLNGTTTYEGRPVVTTFDEVTLISQTILLSGRIAAAPGTAVVDFGGTKITVPSAEINPESRIVRIKWRGKVEDRHF